MTDVFDRLLISTCDIYRKGSGAADAYNIPDQTLTLLQAGVACRKSVTRGGREFKDGKSFSISRFVIFMRPNTNVTEHVWLKIGSDYYNVLGVNNPSGLDHHYEVDAELVTP
jgi:hypothetical protein